MDKQNLIVQVTHRFSQSAERVFDAWLDPDKAAQFLFLSEGGEIVHCEIDARIGGRFVMTDRRPEGDVEHAGEYLEINGPERLVFAYSIPAMTADLDVVTIVIEALDAGCRLTLTHELKPEWADFVDGARDAWMAMLETQAGMLGDAGG